MNDDPMPTRPLVVDRTDLWALHDCLQAALAGFSGRTETAEPWHGVSLMRKVRYALTRVESPTPVPAVTLDLTVGELECLDYNVPRTAYQGAAALLVRVFHALAEVDHHMPLLAEEPQTDAVQRRLAEFRKQSHTDGKGGDVP